MQTAVADVAILDLSGAVRDTVTGSYIGIYASTDAVHV
jgi:hypothetical protein